MEIREVGEEGLITSHHNCRILLLAVPTVDSTTQETWFLSPNSSRRSVPRIGTIDNPAQITTDDLH